MTELLPKPKREDVDCHCDCEEEGIICINCNDFTYKERDYYKRLAEFAIAEWEEMNSQYVKLMLAARYRLVDVGYQCDSMEQMIAGDPALKRSKEALSIIKGSCDEN